VLAAEAADRVQPSLVGLAVQPCGVLVEPLGELGVDQGVQRRHLRSRVSGHAVDDTVGLDERDRPPVLREKKCRRDADDAASHDGDIDLQVPVERRIRRRERGCDPE